MLRSVDLNSKLNNETTLPIFFKEEKKLEEEFPTEIKEFSNNNLSFIFKILKSFLIYLFIFIFTKYFNLVNNKMWKNCFLFRNKYLNLLLVSLIIIVSYFSFNRFIFNQTIKITPKKPKLKLDKFYKLLGFFLFYF